MAEGTDSKPERRSRSVVVSTGTSTHESVVINDEDIDEVTVYDDDSLQINNSAGEMIFYAPAGCWINVYVKHASPADAE